MNSSARTPHDPHPGAASAGRRRVLRALALGLACAAPARAVAGTSPQPAPAPTPGELNALSGDLVARARSGAADATRFRIDATIYRESLRGLMLAAEEGAAAGASHALLLDMVRMAALLNAAAECKTGRYITCPADLMRRLEAQQQVLDAQLGARPQSAPGGG